MGLTRQYLSRTSVLFTLLFLVVSTKTLKFRGERKQLLDTIHTRWYFPQENTLCVVLAEPDEDEFLSAFDLPLVVYTQNHVLQNCEKKLTDQDGYVLLVSNTVNLEEQIVPLLKCFNRTTLKLKTKYILVLHVSNSIILRHEENYSKFFHHIWKSFGIINIAISRNNENSANTEAPLVYLYNPFLPGDELSTKALEVRTLSQDIRGVMTKRSHNMNGYRLRTLFVRLPSSFVTFKGLSKKHLLGADRGVLFKQILEEKLNVSFDVYEPTNSEFISSNSMIGEIISGRAEYCISFGILTRDVKLLSQIWVLSSSFSLELVFVVPKPKRIESWRYFQYIFKWQVCVGLGISMFFLTGAAAFFQYVQSTRINILSHNSSGNSEILSVWKAAFSVSINKLPTSNSQRLLIALSLVLGLIFLTLFSAQQFFLITSKPRVKPITTLQDLHDSNLPIYIIYKEFSPYLNIFENTTLHKLKDNLKTDQMYDKANFMDPSYLNVTDRALLYTGSMVKLVASLPQNKEFLDYFEVVKEPILQSVMVTYMPMGSVYYEHFNDLSLRLISGGFFLKWEDAKKRRIVEHFKVLSTPSAAQKTRQTANDGREPLTYYDLKMAFYILYIGLTVSTLCFIIELCHR